MLTPGSLPDISSPVFSAAESSRGGGLPNRVGSILGEDIDYSVLPESARVPYRAAFQDVLSFCERNTVINEPNLGDFYKLALLCHKAQSICILAQGDKSVTIGQMKHLFAPVSGYALQEFSNPKILRGVILDPDTGLYDRLKDITNFLPVCLDILKDFESGSTSKTQVESIDIIRSILGLGIELEVTGDSSGKLLDSGAIRNICMNIKVDIQKHGIENTGKVRVALGDSSWGITSSNEKRVFQEGETKPHSGGEGSKIMKAIVLRHKGSIEVSGLENEGVNYEIKISDMQYAEAA